MTRKRKSPCRLLLTYSGDKPRGGITPRHSLRPSRLQSVRKTDDLPVPSRQLASADQFSRSNMLYINCIGFWSHIYVVVSRISLKALTIPALQATNHADRRRKTLRGGIASVLLWSYIIRHPDHWAIKRRMFSQSTTSLQLPIRLGKGLPCELT